MIEKIFFEKNFEKGYDAVLVFTNAVTRPASNELQLKKKKKPKVVIRPVLGSIAMPKSFQVFSNEKFLNDQIAPHVKDQSYQAKPGEIFPIYSEGLFRQIVYITLPTLYNKKDGENFVVNELLNTLRELVATVISQQKRSCNIAIDCSKLAFLAGQTKTTEASLVRCITEASFLGDYRFDSYLSKPLAARHTLSLVGAIAITPALQKAARESRLIAQATNHARDLENEPPNCLGVAEFVARATSFAKQAKFKIKTLDTKQLRKQKFGGILAVNAGSDEGAKLLTLEYKPAKPLSHKQSVLFVGKGVLFDSGGLSIKPSKAMEEMKMDMSGAAVVLLALWAISLLKLEVRVIAVIPLTENLIGPQAYRVGDLLSMYNGKTVEVTNTDAEGRLLLADSLAYATAAFNPDYCIDVATLTGACVVALGSEYAGLWSNNDKLAGMLSKSGERTAEALWRMPLDAAYLEDMRSKVADLKNAASTPYGGAITAAKFLQQFIGKGAWAHIDIAGVMSYAASKGYKKAGASGFGVRLLVDFISCLANKTKEK